MWFFFFLFSVLGLKSKALRMLGKCFPMELHVPALNVFDTGYCWGRPLWPGKWDPPASTPGAGIAGMHHHTLTCLHLRRIIFWVWFLGFGVFEMVSHYVALPSLELGDPPACLYLLGSKASLDTTSFILCFEA